MIAGFGNGDVIDLTNLHFTTSGEYVSYDPHSHLLTVFDNGTSETFTLEGNYSPDDFELVNDGHGGTDVVLSIAGSIRRRQLERCRPVIGAVSRAARHGVFEATCLVASGSLVVDLDDKQEVANLFIGDDHTELDIDTGGSLKILNMLENSGAIVVGPTEHAGIDPCMKVPDRPTS